MDPQLSTWKAFFARCNESELGNCCFSNNVGRRINVQRSAIIVPSKSSSESIDDFVVIEPGQNLDSEGRLTVSTAFLFSGQGSQYSGMLRSLYQTSPPFKIVFDECCELFNVLLPKPLESVVWANTSSADAALIHATGYTQPALFTIEYALAKLWISWGVNPDYLIGHSIGEIAAYCVADGCSLENAVRLVSARSRLCKVCQLVVQCAQLRPTL